MKSSRQEKGTTSCVDYLFVLSLQCLTQRKKNVTMCGADEVRALDCWNSRSVSLNEEAWNCSAIFCIMSSLWAESSRVALLQSTVFCLIFIIHNLKSIFETVKVSWSSSQNLQTWNKNTKNEIKNRTTGLINEILLIGVLNDEFVECIN